jgi:hypothetical protein
VDKVIRDYQCGFRRNRLIINQIFSICKVLEKNWKAVRQLFVDFKKPYDSVRREECYSIHIEFWLAMKLIGLIKMSLNETCSKVNICIYLSDKFPN